MARGGRRKNAGRKPRGGKASVSISMPQNRHQFIQFFQKKKGESFSGAVNMLLIEEYVTEQNLVEYSEKKGVHVEVLLYMLGLKKDENGQYVRI